MIIIIMKIGKMQDQNSNSFLLTLKASNIIKKYPYLLQQLSQTDYKCETNKDKQIKLQIITMFDNLRSEQSTLSKSAKLQHKLQSLKIACQKVKNLEKFLSIMKIKTSQANKFRLKIKSQSKSQILNQETLSSGNMILQNLVDKYHNIIVILKKYVKKITFTKFINEFIKNNLNGQQCSNSSSLIKLKKLISHIFNNAQTIVRQLLSDDYQQKSEIRNNIFSSKQKFKDYFELKDFQIYIQVSQGLNSQQIPQDLNQLKIILSWNPCQVNFGQKQQEVPQTIQKYIATLTATYSCESKMSSMSINIWNRLNLFKKINLIKLFKHSFLKNIISVDNEFLYQIIAQVLISSYDNQQYQRIIKSRINKLNELAKLKSQFQSENQFQIDTDQKELAINKNIKSKNCLKITLISQQSEILLDQYYRKYYCSIFSYLQVQKQTYFKLLNSYRDKNFKLVGYDHIKWIPLNYIQNSNVQIKKAQYLNYLSFLLSSYFQNTPLYLAAQNNFQNTQNREQRQMQESYYYNEKYNCLILNSKLNTKYIDLQHFRYNLKLLNNSFKLNCQQKTLISSQQTIKLLIKPSKLMTIKERQVKNQFQSGRLINIPVRGKYCNHVDFYDLSQIYQGQLKKQFQCPKCFETVQAEEIVYLQEMQIFLQMLKLFYLKKGNEPNIKKDIQYKNIQTNQKLFQPTKEVLKDLKLILNHSQETVTVKGYYQNFQLVNKTLTYQFTNKEQFQFTLNQCYATFTNPNLKFKNQKKKINKFLQNYGLSPFLQKIKQDNQLQSNLEKNIYDMNYLANVLSFQQKIELTQKYLRKVWSLGVEHSSETVQQSRR